MKYTTEIEQDVIFWEEKVTTTQSSTIINSNWEPKFVKTEQAGNVPRIKGIYPYEFIDIWNKFNHSTTIPKSEFYDNLNRKHISDQEYAQYGRVWDAIPNCNLGKYSDLYLKIDVLALADVFESFRNTCLASYQLDPAHYYTAPGLSWDAMLKITGVKLELLTDITMFQMIEHGIRDGICSILGDRYVDVEGKNYVTNPDIDKADPNQEWLLYVDANNLYGHALSQMLPTGNFQWLDKIGIYELDHKIRTNQIDHTSNTSAILRINLKVPKTR